MKLLLVIVLAVMLAGCAMKPRPYHYLQHGMTKTDVQAKCGYCPDQRDWSDGTSLWNYRTGEAIWFENGRITSFSW